MTGTEFETKGHTYRVGRMDAKRQFHVLRRMGPIMPGLMALDGKGLDADEDAQAALGALTTALAEIQDVDMDYILDSCLAVAERKQPAGGWARVSTGGALMFEDIDMAVMLQIAWQALQHNLSGFFGGKLPDFSAGGRT
jgi:hypothetical protein